MNIIAVSYQPNCFNYIKATKNSFQSSRKYL